MKRDEYKDLPKGYYHLSTDGRWGGIIFHTPELFAYGMVLMGLQEYLVKQFLNAKDYGKR
jgi:hypothetical protein